MGGSRGREGVHVLKCLGSKNQLRTYFRCQPGHGLRVTVGQRSEITGDDPEMARGQRSSKLRRKRKGKNKKKSGSSHLYAELTRISGVTCKGMCVLACRCTRRMYT